MQARLCRVVMCATALIGFTPHIAFACSKAAFTPVRTRNLAFLIGTASTDTVHAGAGPVRYTVAPGHSGPAGDRPIFGQVVNVERVTGIDTMRLSPSTSKVVLVPWDYGPDCAPTPYMRSVRWLGTDTRGLYHGVLREQSQWVAGVPTLDVFTPERQPYPGPSTRFRDASAETPLSMDELFPLLPLIPDAQRLQDSVEQAVEPLMTWARANPALARRAPMADAVNYATYLQRIARVRRVSLPVLGTYRMQLELPGGGRREFYVRTEGRALDVWRMTRAAAPPPDPTTASQPEGYTVLVVAGASLADLPRGCDDRTLDREAYWSVTAQPSASELEGVTWNGEIEISLITRAFPADSVLLRPFAQAWDAEYSRRFRAQLPVEAPTRFTLPTAAAMRVRTDFVAGDGRRLQLHGVRISDDVTHCVSGPQRF